LWYLILSTVETSQVVTKQELHLGRPGTIVLDVSAYPPLTYDWRKEGQQLIFPMAGKSLDPYTGSISIDNVQEADEGTYTCTVKFGTADTVEIEVTTISKVVNDVVTESCLKLCTVESRFLEPRFTKLQITRTKSRFPPSVQHCDFTPDFSNSPIFRTNFRFPWRFVKSGFHGSSANQIASFSLKHQ